MSLLKFVGSVVVPKTVIIAAATINSANVLGISENIWVTSGNDGVHSRGSKHYYDEALDIRTKNLSKKDKHLLRSTMKARLGKDYDVILEDEGGLNEHIHCEYDPK